VKKILITGSRGFVGSSVLKSLSSQDFKIFEINIEDGDIAIPEILSKFNDKNISHVIHLAGRIYVPDSWDNPALFYSTNVMGTLNVLEFCKVNKCNLTHISAYLYGQPEGLPISENSKIVPDNPYAHSKFLSENLCRFYHDNFNTRINILRPFNVFGIGQNNRFLIPAIIDQVVGNDQIIVNDLTPKRDYIYLEDLTKAIIKTLSCEIDFGIYNIGSGSSLSVEEIINKIQNTFKTNKEVKSKGTIRRGEISDVVADISRAEKELGWKPRYTFEDGLEEIYSEYKM
jgi:nucleoside-diphosphate-sugar epimerase